MARLRTETAPEITVYDESAVFKAATGATAPLVEFKDSSGTVVANIASNGVLNVVSVVASNAGTGSTALATRGYVDSIASGINWHAAVNFATTAALPACTYANGTLGVGATLTGNSNGRLTVDSTAQTTGKSILVKNQADAKQNGIYDITAQGEDGVSVFVLTRRSDANNSIAGQVKAGDAVFVLAGTDNANQGFILTTVGTGTAGAIVFGTDNLDYTQFTGTATVTAGAGISKTGNQLDVGTASSSRIVVNADNIDLATVAQSNSSGSDTTTFVSNLTVDSYGRITGKETSSVSFSSTVLQSLADAKGDLIAASAADTFARLPVGTNGQALRANSAATTGLEWFTLAESLGITDLSDVTITSASNNQFLKYNGSAWVNASVAEINGLTDLSDVTITSASTNQVLSYNGSAWVNTSNPTVAGNLTVTGNLTVSGTTTTVNSTTLSVADNVITLNSDVTTGSPTENAGIEVLRGSSATVALRWNETNGWWEFTNDGTTYQRIVTNVVTNAQTGTAYTLVLADKDKLVEMANASAITLTVPADNTVAYPTGAQITILQTGTGQVTIAGNSGVTVNSTPGLKLRAQWSSATLIKRAANTWVALGDLSA
jgi:hypothetical protein